MTDEQVLKKYAAWKSSYKRLPMTERELNSLGEYSASLPTGQTPGKRWKKHVGSYDRQFIAAGGKPFWIIGEYDPNDDGKGKTIEINWYLPVARVKALSRPIFIDGNGVKWMVAA